MSLSSLIGSLLQRSIEGPPDALPPPPVYNPPPVPLPPKKILSPSAPGSLDQTSNAYRMDEKRRILGGLPVATKDVYAGADTTNPNLKKPRLLGGGVGQQTSGV